jgi:hypothetical protein
MHQSPLKHVPLRRDKDVDFDSFATDAEAERRFHRGGQPKARRSPQRDEEYWREVERRERHSER